MNPRSEAMEKKYKAQKEFSDFRRRKHPPLPTEDEGRRTQQTSSKKMRVEREKELNNNAAAGANNNDNSNSTTGSSSFQGSGRRSRSPRPGFDPATSLPKPQSPLSSSFSRGPGSNPGRGSKLVNWRLACFMAREYLSRGTLLGRPWPSRDSNRGNKSKTSVDEQDETPESRKDKERLYSILTDDFLRSDDIHIPGIVNPTQFASWMGFK